MNKISYTKLPAHMQDAMQRYIEQGIQPGDFLLSVLRNDLYGACTRADYINRDALLDYIYFLYDQAPPLCFGSRERTDAWIAVGGKQGRAIQEETQDA
jgi:hypothetical protein